MRSRPGRAARDAAVGARALLKGEKRPFRAKAARGIPRVGGRTHVLPAYESRDALAAAARRQALLARGRKRFIWQARVVGVGVPLGIAAGVLAWRSGDSARGRSVAQFVAAFAATLGLTLLEAKAEWRGMEEAGQG